MPNQPATFNKTVRVEADLWDRAGQVAGAQATTRAAVINAFLRWYVAEPGAELPGRAERGDGRSDPCDTLRDVSVDNRHTGDA